MGEITDTLNEFQEISRRYYRKIMEVLEEKYCWKCPMRTNSKEALCREVEAWVRLVEAMEAGVKEEFALNAYSIDVMEVITAKFLEKRMKKSYECEESIVIKLKYDAEPYAKEGDFIYLKPHPLKVKKDDLIVLPNACPIATYWYIKASKQSILPFKIYRVSRVFQKRECRYVKTEDGWEVPVEYLMGVVKNIITKEILLQSEK